MKKVEFFLAKSLIATFICFSAIACDETSEKITDYPISPVTNYENDTARISMSHTNMNVNKFELYKRGELTCTAGVFYRADGIFCMLNGIQYHIEPDNVLGSTRAKKISASIGGSLYYEVEYFYKDERLVSATIGVPPDGPYYTSYAYYDSKIVVEDWGRHEIELSNEENTGYAFNVLGHAEMPLTSQYVINPALYFLNIYGKPVEKLPSGYEIERSGKTMRVGNHLYEYRD
ncbi:MAG: hypothetical protein LBL57_01510 [Tannerella sp.]|jgi:hypothetical protein|nr:hypothetical protein [Tannerella sp.]